VATVAVTLRLRRNSTTLLLFGLWCALYGARMLALQPPVRGAIGGPPHQLAQFIALVTYTINVPITIFVGSLIGDDWRRSIRWLVGAVSAFAAVAIATDLISGIAGAASPINTWVVLATISVGLVAIAHSYAARGVRTPLTDPIVMFGGFVLVLLVINQNLGQIVASPVNIEPIGVLVFILCLGYALGRSVFRAEAEFVSVQRELERARQIQLSLLPRRVPSPAGLDVAVRCVRWRLLQATFTISWKLNRPSGHSRGRRDGPRDPGGAGCLDGEAGLHGANERARSGYRTDIDRSDLVAVISTVRM
jgi:hypothetical protein